MLNDIRYAIRTLRKNPGFALTAILSIGLAIGANSAIFGFIDALLLRPFPVLRASDVVAVQQIKPAASASGLANLGGSMSYPDFVYLRENDKSFVDLLAYELIVGFCPRFAHSAADPHGVCRQWEFLQRPWREAAAWP
jgi:hypothetical protein